MKLFFNSVSKIPTFYEKCQLSFSKIKSRNSPSQAQARPLVSWGALRPFPGSCCPGSWCPHVRSQRRIPGDEICVWGDGWIALLSTRHLVSRKMAPENCFPVCVHVPKTGLSDRSRWTSSLVPFSVTFGSQQHRHSNNNNTWPDVVAKVFNKHRRVCVCATIRDKRRIFCKVTHVLPSTYRSRSFGGRLEERKRGFHTWHDRGRGAGTIRLFCITSKTCNRMTAATTMKNAYCTLEQQQQQRYRTPPLRFE